MAYTPVLRNTPPAEVECIVRAMLREARAYPVSSHTVCWLLTRALHWVIENAPGFISGSARAEAKLGHLQADILAAGAALLWPEDYAILKRYHALLLDGDDVYVRPVCFESGDELFHFLTQATYVVHPLDRWCILKICRIYDALTLNCHLLPTLQKNLKPFLLKVMVQYTEFVASWPYFETIFPRRVMQPILWMIEE